MTTFEEGWVAPVSPPPSADIAAIEGCVRD
jgi:hypothetical protein